MSRYSEPQLQVGENYFYLFVVYHGDKANHSRRNDAEKVGLLFYYSHVKTGGSVHTYLTFYYIKQMKYVVNNTELWYNK